MSLIELPVLGLPTNSKPPLQKIALEEHFYHPALFGPIDQIDFAAIAKASGTEEAWLKVALERINDLHGTRIEEMNASGIAISILSLMSPGIEGIPDAAKAISAAREVNDFLAVQIAGNPERFAGFASLPLQDVDAAVKELDRCIRTMGFKGVMVNGYVNLGSRDVASYLDDPRYFPFWEAVSGLDVPVYLHPRAPLDRLRYEGHRELEGATWGFGVETATHALQLVNSGLFDRYPNLTLILGHLGEGLPAAARRTQDCFAYNPLGKSLKEPLEHYLGYNFYYTTSGNASYPALACTRDVVGMDRILFATDYPFEMSTKAAKWIEEVPISERDRLKIAYGNANSLFKLGREFDVPKREKTASREQVRSVT